mmetsp:Transcript_52000/g.105960  ORF Transcript_52000/g.105960 Transcript_52000/m.105960 type:complete len:235 (+) Transcript_52000:440-1144(+)
MVFGSPSELLGMGRGGGATLWSIWSLCFAIISSCFFAIAAFFASIRSWNSSFFAFFLAASNFAAFASASSFAASFFFSASSAGVFGSVWSLTALKCESIPCASLAASARSSSVLFTTFLCIAAMRSAWNFLFPKRVRCTFTSLWSMPKGWPLFITSPCFLAPPSSSCSFHEEGNAASTSAFLRACICSAVVCVCFAYFSEGKAALLIAWKCFSSSAACCCAVSFTAATGLGAAC